MRKLALTALILLASPGFAQMPNPYGESISSDNAKKIAALSVAEARKNNWKMAIAIVDIAGDLYGADVSELSPRGITSARATRVKLSVSPKFY